MFPEQVRYLYHLALLNIAFPLCRLAAGHVSLMLVMENQISSSRGVYKSRIRNAYDGIEILRLLL